MQKPILIVGGKGKGDGRVTDGVQRALGRPPRDFAHYAQAAAARGVWRQA